MCLAPANPAQWIPPSREIGDLSADGSRRKVAPSEGWSAARDLVFRLACVLHGTALASSPIGSPPHGTRGMTKDTQHQDIDSTTNDPDTKHHVSTTSTLVAPSVTFQSVTFSDGTTIKIAPDDVVVFVGPNNAGKSQALHDLEQTLNQRSYSGVVVRSATDKRRGSVNDLRTYLSKHSNDKGSGALQNFEGYRFSVRSGKVARWWSDHGSLGSLTRLFCMRLATEDRITASDPAQAIDTLNHPASHPIHLLYSNEELERRISGYFRKAFGEDLVVDRLGGSRQSLLVGTRPSLEKGEHLTSHSYCRRLRLSTVPLTAQGDGMRSFASVVLHLLAPVTPSILLLDEPEAFLHPPQARLLGELVVTERSPRTQVFMATHSADVLDGLLRVAPDNLRVIRMRRDGDINRVTELDKKRAKEISSDPLMRSSAVLTGVFHERVIICEGDADRMFYSSLLDLPSVHGGRQPDVHFVHASGKHRMATLAQSFRELDVLLDVIADIDVIREEGDLKRLVGALGGAWPEIQPTAHQVRTSIDNRPGPSASKLADEIRDVLDDMDTAGEFPSTSRRKIDKILRANTHWGHVKKAGESAIPAGQATQHFAEFCELCESIGLWIVRVGELEGFCRSVGGHGPAWVQEVIQKRDLLQDEELRSARNFVKDIWQSRRQAKSR